MRNFGPCMCGATDCPSCGPAQGYEVRRRRTASGRIEWYNPDEEDDSDPDSTIDEDKIEEDDDA